MPVRCAAHYAGATLIKMRTKFLCRTLHSPQLDLRSLWPLLFFSLSVRCSFIFKESFRDQRWAWEESVRAEKRDRDAEREKETFRRQRHHQSFIITLSSHAHLWSLKLSLKMRVSSNELFSTLKSSFIFFPHPFFFFSKFNIPVYQSCHCLLINSPPDLFSPSVLTLVSHSFAQFWVHSLFVTFFFFLTFPRSLFFFGCKIGHEMHFANILTWHVRRHRDDSNQTALWYLGQQSYQTWTAQSRCGDWPGRTLCAKRCPETVRGNFRLHVLVLLHNADNGSRATADSEIWVSDVDVCRASRRVDLQRDSDPSRSRDRTSTARGHGQREPATAAQRECVTVARVYVYERNALGKTCMSSLPFGRQLHAKLRIPEGFIQHVQDFKSPACSSFEVSYIVITHCNLQCYRYNSADMWTFIIAFSLRTHFEERWTTPSQKSSRTCNIDIKGFFRSILNVHSPIWQERVR